MAFLQVRYGWTPTAGLGPQMARLSERAKAATLRDCADRIDYEAAFGSEAWHSPESPAKVNSCRQALFSVLVVAHARDLEVIWAVATDTCTSSSPDTSSLPDTCPFQVWDVACQHGCLQC